MAYNLQDFKDELSAARTFVMFKYPFYSNLINHFTFLASEEIPTAGVNIRDQIFINPTFFHNLKSPTKRGFLLCHEVLHPALGIFWRGKGHDPILLNQAHDYVINLILEAEDKEWVIPGGLLDHKYDNMPYEEVYWRLLQEEKEYEQKQQDQNQGGEGQGGSGQQAGGGGGKQKKQPGQGGGDDSDEQQKQQGKGAGNSPKHRRKNSLGGDIDMTGADGAKEGEDGKSPLEGSGLSDEELASRWRARLAQAAQVAKMFGKLPACLQREIDDLVEPSVPWQEHLQLFVAEAAHKSRLDWDQPHRRYTVLDSYAPREVFMGCNVAVYVNTSGSVSQEQLVQAAAETREIIRASGGQIRWICGDADIAKEEWISEDEASKFEGGGGTSFVPLFEHLSENPPKALVVITDTWGTHWHETPDYPVLWAVYSSALKAGVEVPFGEVVEVEEYVA